MESTLKLLGEAKVKVRTVATKIGEQHAEDAETLVTVEEHIDAVILSLNALEHSTAEKLTTLSWQFRNSQTGKDIHSLPSTQEIRAKLSL